MERRYERRSFFSVLSFFLFASPAAADLIIGQVVDPNGVGVPGANIDAIDLFNGGQATLLNDGTDANGFFSTTIDPGVYRIVFKPPPPPTTTLLVREVNNVVVSGTKDMGTIALLLGVSLGARTVDVSGFPVANVNVDVIDLGTGQKVPLQGDHTNAFGTFTIAVPTTPIEVQFRTDNVFPTLAPKARELTLSANTDLGDVTLRPGFLLEGTVERSGGTPVSGADTDVLVSSSGHKLFTPNDNTDVDGFFSVVVPAGTYDVEICPKAADLLVATELLMLSITGDTDVGTITLQSGVVLSGTITNSMGAPVQGADVDVRDSTTGAAVVLCSDNSNASGAYSVVVPTGTFDVTFSPPGCSWPLAQDRHLDVVITGNTTLNGVLPAVTCKVRPFAGPPPPVPLTADHSAGPRPGFYGSSVASTGGIVPWIGVSSSRPGGIELGNTFEGARSILFVTDRPDAVAAASGRVFVNPAHLLDLHPLRLEGRGHDAGTGSFHLPLSALELRTTARVYLRLAVLDPHALGGVALSKTVELPVPSTR